MMYFDKEGLAISMQSWAMLMESPTYRVIKQDDLADGRWVSTVWLGLNHAFGSGKKMIFETMAFTSKVDGDVVDARRYSTVKEAIVGHNEMVAELNAHPSSKYHKRKLEP